MAEYALLSHMILKVAGTVKIVSAKKNISQKCNRIMNNMSGSKNNSRQQANAGDMRKNQSSAYIEIDLYKKSCGLRSNIPKKTSCSTTK